VNGLVFENIEHLKGDLCGIFREHHSVNLFGNVEVFLRISLELLFEFLGFLQENHVVVISEVILVGFVGGNRFGGLLYFFRGGDVSVRHIVFESSRALVGIQELLEVVKIDKVSFRMLKKVSHGNEQTSEGGKVHRAGATLAADHVQHQGSEIRGKKILLHGFLDQVPGDLVGKGNFQFRNVVTHTGQTGVLENVDRVGLPIVVSLGDGHSSTEESFFFDRRDRLDACSGDGKGTGHRSRLETAVSTSFPGMIDLSQENVVVEVGVVGVHVM